MGEADISLSSPAHSPAKADIGHGTVCLPDIPMGARELCASQQVPRNTGAYIAQANQYFNWRLGTRQSFHGTNTVHTPPRLPVQCMLVPCRQPHTFIIIYSMSTFTSIDPNVYAAIGAVCKSWLQAQKG